MGIRYTTPSLDMICRHWLLTRIRAPQAWERQVLPHQQGVFITPFDELVMGQWGMIPPGANARIMLDMDGESLRTHFAPIERVGNLWTYRKSWKQGRRCLIPAESYELLDQSDTRQEWRSCRRADGKPWALAGLFGFWVDMRTLERVPHFTMLTQASDGPASCSSTELSEHKIPAGKKGMRTVVPVEPCDWETWLRGSQAQAAALVKLPDADVFELEHAEG